MTSTDPTRRPTRPVPLVGLVAALTALGLAGCQAVPSHSSSIASLTEGTEEGAHAPLGTDEAVAEPGEMFDGDDPAVANLDPDLLDALRRAAAVAVDDEIEIVVSSGWRSPELQDHLLAEAVRKYGSEEEAARWVATAETSAHVSGEAVDIGTVDGILWLSEHGAAYGLCQVYENESWHFELRPEAAADGCPPMYTDPTQDPRLQQ